MPRPLPPVDESHRMTLSTLRRCGLPEPFSRCEPRSPRAQNEEVAQLTQASYAQNEEIKKDLRNMYGF